MPVTPVLARDALAGITVAVVLIPQALAYADVAGMPPVTGLHAAALPLLAAAPFVSSPYLQTGPVATTSLLTFGAITSLAPTGSNRYVELALLLALVVGVVRVLVGVFRLGKVAHLMSEPLLMGFVPAAALLIIASQVPAAVGADVDGTPVEEAISALMQPQLWQPAAIAFALGSIAIVLLGWRLHRLFPGVLIALLVGFALSAAFDIDVETIGTLPPGLPHIDLDLPYSELPSLMIPGAVIALVGFSEASSIARTYATIDRQRWNPNREFVSQGVANLAAAASGGFPVGGSLSRSALNRASGAVTRLSGAITGAAVLFALPLASVLSELPKSVLAAIVMSTVLGLIRLRPILRLWHVSRPQFGVAASTFILTLALSPHIERAILIGLVLSILVHLWRELGLRIECRLVDDALEIRPLGVLWFATAADLPERLIDLLAEHPDVRQVTLALDGLGRVDLAGAMSLARVTDDLTAAGIAVRVTGIPPHATELLRRPRLHT